MKTKYCVSAIALSVFLTGCVAAPVRDDSRVQNSIGIAGVGVPRLPGSSEAYLDDAWFSDPLTLNRAVQAALLNNPQVRAELTRLDGAQAERIQAGLIRNPVATLMVLRPDGGGRFELDYGLMQSLFDLFARSRRITVATAAQERVQAEVMMQLLKIAQDTVGAYYQVIAANDTLALQKKQLALEAKLLTLFERQARQGVLSSNAVLTQQTEVFMREHELKTAETLQIQALSTLAISLGLTSSKSLVLTDDLLPVKMPVLDEPQLQRLALKYRPELAAANASVEQARAERQLQTGALRNTDPSIGLAGIRESGGLSLNGLVGQITLPIFDNGVARSELADAQINRVQFQAEATRRLIPLEVERALASLVANSKSLDHADHHVMQEQELEKLATRAYQQGTGDYTQVVAATRLRLVSQLEQVQAQWMFRSALLDLERATGVAMKNAP